MKTQVIGDVTQSTSIPMTQLDVTQNPVFAHNNPQASSANIIATYSSFLSKSASTGSEVNAYFPENHIPAHWANLVGLVHNFYLFTYATYPGARQSNLNHIRGYFDFHHIQTGVDWGTLLNGDPHSVAYQASWTKLEHLILDVRNQLTGAIMDAPAPNF